jgi:hypothetical protein
LSIGHKSAGGLNGRVVGLQAADHLDQRHHRHRVEEVHADEALRVLRRRGELRDRDR